MAMMSRTIASFPDYGSLRLPNFLQEAIAGYPGDCGSRAQITLPISIPVQEARHPLSRSMREFYV